MSRRLLSVPLCVLLFGGCSSEPASSGGTATAPPAAASSSSSEITSPEPAPSTTRDDTFALSSENTTIQFVGTHVGDKPDPRKGQFSEFSGTMVADPAAGSVTSISVEIQTASLSTEIEKLTNHLKSPDFFDVRQFPTATFESTSITPGEGDTVTVTGNLTLHGETREIEFPATVTVNDDGVTLESSFTIDRTQFGMDYGLEQVEKEVAMTVTVEA